MTTQNAAETVAESTAEQEYAGTFIIVEVGRHTLDPQGESSDEWVEKCEEYILDSVRESFPGAEVSAGGRGAVTGGRTRDGQDISDDVHRIVSDALKAFCEFVGAEYEKSTTIRADSENCAEEWWDAARAAARTDDSKGAEVFRSLNEDPDRGVEVNAEELAAFKAWASSLPGHDDGPEYARRPYLVEQD